MESFTKVALTILLWVGVIPLANACVADRAPPESFTLPSALYGHVLTRDNPPVVSDVLGSIP